MQKQKWSSELKNSREIETSNIILKLLKKFEF